MNKYSDQKKINMVSIALLSVVLIDTVTNLFVFFFPGISIFDNIVFNLVFSQITNIAPFIVFFVLCGDNFFKEIRFRKIKPVNYILVIVLGFLIQPVLSFVNLFSLSFTSNAANPMIFSVFKTVPYWAAVLLTAVMPAICEETVYRGALCQTYRKAGSWKAVILSGFIFGLMHGNLNQFCYAFVMGVIFGLLVEATGSIVPAMIIHFITNFESTTSVYIIPKAYELIKNIMSYLYNNDMAELADDYAYAYGIDMNMSGEEWLYSAMQVTAQTKITFVDLFVEFFPALIAGTLACLLFMAIAKKEGRWVTFKETFLSHGEDAMDNERAGLYTAGITTGENNNGGDRNLRINSLPLMVAIAIAVILMYVYEMLSRLPQTIV